VSENYGLVDIDRGNYVSRHRMTASFKKFSQGVEICFHGRLDSVTSPLALEVLNSLPKPFGKFLLFNLSELEYVSSAGLRVILGVAKQAKADSNSSLFALRTSTHVRDVLEISGFDTMLKMVEEFDYELLGDKQLL